MATKAGTAYVEVKYDPDSIQRLRATTMAEGKKISKSWKDADTGLIEFDKAAKKVNKTMSGGPFGLFDTIGNVGYALLKMGGFAQDAEKNLGTMFTTASDGEGIMATLGTTLTSLAPLAGVAATGFVALGAALLVLPALAAAVTFAFVALLDTVTILSAVVVAFLGPLSLLAGLLGGLAAGFILGGKAALVGKHSFHDFGQTIKDLKEQFDKFGKLLGHLFLPYFIQLAHAASIALTYLSKIAKLPLAQAFHSLATDGLAMLSKFLYGVANVLKRPFRLAIQVAFGAGGANANQAISKWWDSLTKYLFGYTKTKPIHIGSAIVMDKQNIRGALDPIIAFFHRQSFVSTGIRWGREIINGLIRLWNHDKELRDAVKTVLREAGHQSGRAFKAAFFAEMHAIPWGSLGKYIISQLNLNKGIENSARTAFNFIRGIAGPIFSSIGNSIKTAFGNAWNWVRSKALEVWNYITGLFSRTISLHISVPHIPGIHIPFTAAGGTTVRSGLQWVGERGPELVNMPRGATVIPNHESMALAGGGDIYLTLDLGEGITQRLKIDKARTARTIQAGRKW